jgi:hypothetical protein
MLAERIVQINPYVWRSSYEAGACSTFNAVSIGRTQMKPEDLATKMQNCVNREFGLGKGAIAARQNPLSQVTRG